VNLKVSSESKKKEPRMASIETFRVLAMFAIICIHTAPFYSMGVIHPRYKIFAYLLMSIFRFAVPFFFLSAGYFFGKGLARGNDPSTSFWRIANRLGVLFLLWSLLYALLPNVFSGADWWLSGWHAAVLKFQTDRINFFLEGTDEVLWFLPALIVAYAILTFFIVIKRPLIVFFVSIVLLLVGLLGSFYAPTPAGIHLPYSFHFRSGPFFSTFFVFAGWWLSTLKKPFLSATSAVLLLGAGFLIQEAEMLLIASHYQVTPKFDYVIGTIPFALGFFLLALAKPEIGITTVFPKLAVLTLGVYLSHPYIKTILIPWAHLFNPFLWQLIFPVIVLVISSLLIYVLRKNQAIRFLVS